LTDPKTEINLRAIVSARAPAVQGFERQNIGLLSLALRIAHLTL
jgi:hypothetical protein